MAHTPGPWSLGDITDGEGRSLPFEAVVYGGADDDETEVVVHGLRAKHDARLIASAPDLLAACRAYVEWFDNTYDGEPMEMNRHIAIEMMRAAIAKAEGRS